MINNRNLFGLFHIYFRLCVIACINIRLLLSWLLLSSVVAGMADYLPFPCCTTRLVPRSQSDTFHTSRLHAPFNVLLVFLFRCISFLTTSSSSSASLLVTCLYPFSPIVLLFASSHAKCVRQTKCFSIAYLNQAF